MLSEVRRTEVRVPPHHPFRLPRAHFRWTDAGPEDVEIVDYH
jgi:hypothetical protein